MCNDKWLLNPQDINLKVKSRDTIKTPIDDKSEMSKKLGDTTKGVGNISAIVRLKDYAYDVESSAVAWLED